jgi:Phytochelatin synthase
MKRWHYVSIISMVVTVSLIVAGAALVVGQSHVPSEAIASSVTRTPELMERAWHLPVAATFHRHVNWQSNGSRCGPAAVANAYRSLGEAASTEGKVLAGTGRCWTGICILGLTLDELAEIARTNTSRKVTVLRDLGEDQFLEHLRRSNDLHRRYIVFRSSANFWRGCWTSFAHWGLPRRRRPGFRARC